MWIEASNGLYIREACFGYLCGSQIELFSKAAKVLICLLSLWTPLFQKYEPSRLYTAPRTCYVCSSTKFSQYPARQSWNVCCTRIVFIKLVVLSCSETYSKQGIMFVNRPYWPYCRIVFGNSPFNLVNEQQSRHACQCVYYILRGSLDCSDRAVSLLL